MLSQRVYVDIATCIVVLIFPWYISMIVVIGLVFFFPIYIEGLFFAFLFDTLYAQRIAFPYVFLLSTVVLLLIVYVLKTQIRR